MRWHLLLHNISAFFGCKREEDAFAPDVLRARLFPLDVHSDHDRHKRANRDMKKVSVRDEEENRAASWECQTAEFDPRRDAETIQGQNDIAENESSDWRQQMPEPTKQRTRTALRPSKKSKDTEGARRGNIRDFSIHKNVSLARKQ